MERIQFFQSTDNRYLKTQIKYLIRESLRSREEELNERRKKLRNLIESEHRQYDQELANLFNDRDLKNAYNRKKWIEASKLERAKVEEEFVKQKKLQQELENCDEMRPLQSEQILAETKQAQLYQIEEKRAMRLKEKETDRIWLETLQLLDREKEKQELYENDIRKTIAGETQSKLSNQVDEVKKSTAKSAIEKKREHNLDDKIATRIDIEYKNIEADHERQKKLQQCDALQKQIRTSQMAIEVKTQDEMERDRLLIQRESMQILKEKDRQRQIKLEDRDSQQKYMEYIKNEKHELDCKQKRQNIAVLAQGHTMPLHLSREREAKVPYRKSVR